MQDRRSGQVASEYVLISAALVITSVILVAPIAGNDKSFWELMMQGMSQIAMMQQMILNLPF